MENKKFIKFSILGLLLGAVSLVGLSDVLNNITQVNSYTKDGTLTENIDLRDNEPDEIREYYSALNGKSASELQGNNLLKNLKPILKNGQKYYKYDGDSLWALYEIIDRDWDKSPASEISGYDASTNTITGYKYGSSTSSKGTNPYIHALYVDRSVDNQTRAWDDHQQSQWGINQEHIWPKSQGFNAGGAGGARGDPMHLWAGNGRVNGTEHNNNMYGFVDTSKTYSNPYEAKGFKNLKDNYSGKSLTMPSSNDTVFEPQDCDKGDIARAIFYMVARYNNIAGNDSTINQDNPNLALKQTTQSLTSFTTTSSNKQTGYMGLMTDLLYWNHLDPVDEFEIHRNNLLFNNYTFNRNPFIDYPEWADYIWGKPVYNGRNYVSYSSTPTGSVDLSTDVINGFKGAQPQQVTVSSIEVTKKPTKLVYNVGETLDTSGMVVKAHMSNNTTRTLSAGDYTVSLSGALKASDNFVTVTYEGKTDSFAIAVKSSGGQSETVTYTLNLTKDIFPSTVSVSGGYANFNGTYTVTATSQEGKTKDVSVTTSQVMKGTGDNSDKLQFQGSSGEISGTIENATIVSINSDINTLTYTINGASFSAKNASKNAVYPSYVVVTFTIEEGGSAPTIDVASITLNKTSKTLEIGQSDNLTATISPSNATVQLVSWSSSDFSIVDVNDEGEITAVSAGSATITCSALDESGVTATCEVTVNAPVTLTSITLSGEYPTGFYLGDQFSSEGLIVTANYSNNTHIDVTDDVEITGYDMESETIQTVTVSYGDISTTYSIEVKEKSLAENETIIIASQLGLVNKDSITGYQDGKSVVSVSFVKGSGTQPVYNSSTSSFRIYQKNSFIITSSKTMTKIEFEISEANSLETAIIEMDGLNGNVWTGSSNNLTFVMNNSTSQRNIISIKVTYDLESEELVYLTSITLSGDYQTSFIRNDEFSSEGLVVTAHYSDESSAEVTPTSISSPNMGTSGNKTVTVSYTEGEITKTETYTIEVVAISTVSITLSGNYKTTFYQGEEYDPSGMRITEHYNNGGVSAQHLPTSQGCTITGYDMNAVGEQTVSVSWNGVSTTYTINVLARPSTKVPSYVEGWFLVNDVSNLEVGGIYTFASVAKKSVALPMGSNKYFTAIQKSDGVELTNVSFDGDMMTPDEGIEPVQLTLGGESGKWTFTDETGLIGTSEAKVLNHNGDGTTTWNVSFDEDNAIIASTSDTCGSIQFNSGSPRFLNYTSVQSPISLFRFEQKRTDITFTASLALTQAIVSAQEILDAECLAKKVTTRNWTKIETAIVPFLEDSTSDDYKALMFGEAVSSEVGGNLLEDFLARYDFIVSQYGYKNFIADSTNNVKRSIKSNKSSNIFGNDVFDSNSALVILIISLSTVLAIGGYFISKKKKAERE